MIDFPETGKIQDEFLKANIYPFTGVNRPEINIGPAYGVDVSIVDLPSGFAMALTSDPLSLIPTLGLEESAWLSVHLMANDMATTGKPPMYSQFVLNLPADISTSVFNIYWQHIHSICSKIGVGITGGHTGRFEGINSTIAGGGTMITIAPRDQLLTSKDAGIDDALIVTKGPALVASSILSMSFPETVKKYCGKEIQEKASELFYETSSLQAGLIADEVNSQTKAITAMHDVTEGGILGAIYEMAVAAGLGVKVYDDRLPKAPVQESVCACFDLDPRFCIGAGSMIMATKKGKAEKVIQALKNKGIEAFVVGSMTAQKSGMVLIENDVENKLEHPGTDPYWAAFYKAIKQGLK
ncbi:MAG: AIR synthase-related protein [Cyclobacteriaceae bacterium]